jgi:hypothetical protein
VPANLARMVTWWPVRLRAIGFGVPLSNKIFMGEGWGFRQALTGKVQDGFYFLWRDVEHFGDLGERHASFEILKYRLNWHPSSTEDPGAAYFAGDALYGWALGPIECWHLYGLLASE